MVVGEEAGIVLVQEVQVVQEVQEVGDLALEVHRGL